MRTHAPAFLISVLIHLALLLFFVFVGVSLLPRQGPPEETLAISLRMFQPPPPAPVVQAPESELAPLPPPPEPVIEVPPEPVEQPQPPPKPEPRPRQRPQRVVKPKPSPPIPTEQAKEEVSLVAVEQKQKQQKEVTPDPPPMADESLLRRVEEAYKNALRLAIERHKGYPRRAIRLRQEGEATVGFTIRRDGSITDLRVVESSGSALLDRAAQEAVRQVDGRLPIPEEIERETWVFTLPINYALR